MWRLEGIEVRPLPHGLAHVGMGPVAARGRRLRVTLDEDRTSVTVDGERFEGPRGEVLRVGWDEVGPLAGGGSGSRSRPAPKRTRGSGGGGEART